MVSSRQRVQIKKRMRRIKDATDAGEEEKARRRTKELYDYLEREGIVNPRDE